MPFRPWQLLQLTASAAPRAALPCASCCRVEAVQATVEAGCAVIATGARALALGRPTARQITLQRSRPSASLWTDGNHMKPISTATMNSATVALIHTAKRESRDAWRPPLLIVPGSNRQERSSCSGKETGPVDSHNLRRSG